MSRHRRGLSTISAWFQRSFSAASQDHGVNASSRRSPHSSAASAPGGLQTGGALNTGGTAGAVTAVPLPDRRKHEGEQQLELKQGDQGRGASAPSPLSAMRWLA